jgi:hypothetical protein
METFLDSLMRVCKFTRDAMDTERTTELIERNIQLELLAAELYHLFCETHPEDADFWRELYQEEKSHACLIRAAKDSFLRRGKFPHDLIAQSLNELQQTHAQLETLLRTCRETPPSRRETFDLAIEIEHVAGESHFAGFMDKSADTTTDRVIQQLNEDDKDHGRRIRAYRDRCLPPES